ncbi:MAG: Uma2 family endonuclease [Dehalococcoidia bacterium]|nr:Uma2 family endonuclease [Dehalococcoidia bacterium]
MVATGEKLMTAAELAAMPDDGMRHELVKGVLTTMAPSSEEHAIVAGRVTKQIARHEALDALGEILTADGGFRLATDPDTVRAPDLSFVRHDKVRPPGQRKGFARVAPDFVLEVLSPSNSAGEVNAKISDYLAAGTSLIWVVDPETRTVTAYRQGGEAQFLGVDDEIDGGDVLPGFRCRISEFFADSRS